MAKMQWWEHILLWLVVIGALNWGLVGVFSFNFVDWLFGVRSVASIVVYVLIGIGGIIALISIYANRKK
jgi:hypothetical protein